MTATRRSSQSAPAQTLQSLPAGWLPELPELKLGKEHDVAVVIAKHGKEEAEEAPVESAEVPAAKVAKKDDK